MPKCLYCLKNNEEQGDECKFCFKPLRAGTAPLAKRPNQPAKPQAATSLNAAVIPNSGQQAASNCCPLCQRSDKKWEKAKPLYDVLVCKKCSDDFANLRTLAHVIDKVVWMFGPYMAMLTFMSILPGLLAVCFAILMLLMMTIGFTLKDGFNGKSIGKRVLGLQVVDQNSGAPIGLWKSFLRNIVFYIPILPLIALLTLSKGKRIGDDWANSRVVWDKHLGKGPFWNLGATMQETGSAPVYSAKLGKV